MKTITSLVSGLLLLALSTTGLAGPGNAPPGLSEQAKQELTDVGLDKYLGQFSPTASDPVGQGWTQHFFNPNFSEGPLCIAGTPYSVYTKIQDPKKLLIMMQGGGACWQDFYFCNVLAETQAAPPEPPFLAGIWTDSFDTGSEVIPNPIGDWSVVYMPYCDGSVFAGDNAVVDFAFQAFIEASAGLPPGTGPFVRFHRGLQNASAGIDIARELFPKARRIMLAGSSAGGVGAASLTPFLVRMAFGNKAKLTVFNDAGPVAINLFDVDAMLARVRLGFRPVLPGELRRL